MGAKADFKNMGTFTVVSPIPIHMVHIDHPKDQILGDPKSAVQTKGMAKKSSGVHAFISYIHKQRRTNHKDYANWLFSCFLSQDGTQKVDLPSGKKAIRIKWLYMNKKDERGIVVRNKARLAAQGHRQEEGIDYDEVFAPMAQIEAIRIFLAFASFMGFIVYQMDVKSAFLYGTIEEEVYVDDIIYGSTKKSLCDEFEALMHKRFQTSSIGELTFFLGLQTQKPLVNDEEAVDVDVHLYRSMIGSLMYLTASRPDIMFAVCACSRDSQFDLEVYSNNYYVGANLDRKSTTGGCQFLGMRLIVWQCKKHTIVATSNTKAEYVAAANYYEQVL
nr:hypothetical protein [Tanacetum cinerariifolium]